MSDRSASVTLNGKTIDLELFSPTLGHDVLAISSLSELGVFTYDPGYAVTASCESKITFIDGGKGILMYRGYPIAQLAEQCDFMDTCHLLLHGELPNEKEKTSLTNTIQKHAAVDENFSKLFSGFERNSHPMAMLISAMGALAASTQESFNILEAKDREMAAINLIAKMSTLTAMTYRHNQGLPFVAPKKAPYAENFLYMLFSDTDQSKQAELPVLVRAMDRILTLQADHEQNASTATVRLAGSTGTSPYASMAAGIAALWGPAHGGANEACLNMLKMIGDESKIPEYITKAKDKDDPFRLMGFGHRVYKNYDPRAKIMRETCHKVLEALGLHDTPLFKLAMELERIALEDPYFVDRKLYPNVDFYSGITLNALGIPSNLFTAIFALSRTSGWVSQWLEMMSEPHRIGRPRQLYTGPTERDVAK